MSFLHVLEGLNLVRTLYLTALFIDKESELILRISTTAIVLAGLTVLCTATHGDFNVLPTDVKTVAASAQADQAHRELQKAEEVRTWVLGLEDGERTPQVIQKEVSDIAGDSAPIEWSVKNIKGSFKLTQIASHFENLESRFELLHIWTLPEGRNSEDQVTHFTHRIQAADEQLIQSQLVIPKSIESKNGKIIFNSSGRMNYRFHLDRDELRGNFSLREPVGTYEIGPVQADSFDPIGQLAHLGNAFEEVGEYQYEIPYNEKIYSVVLTPRFTDLGTLTIEVQIHEIRSLQSTTHVLVYEPIEST